MQVQPYLSFEGRSEEAAEFYRKTLGAEITMLLRFKDNPEPPPPGMTPAGMENKILHMSLRIGDTTLMGSDGDCQGPARFEGVTLALSVSSDAEADRVFAALAEGGRVISPLMKTFFSSSFGLVADRFGVSWMIIAAA